MKNKKTIGNRKILLAISSVLFLGSLIYGVYMEYGPFKSFEDDAKPTEIIPEYFDYGTVADSSYCIDFYEFRMPIPKAHEGDHKIYDYTDISFYERDSVLATPRLAANANHHDLLTILPKLVKIDIKEDFEGWMNYRSEKFERESYDSDYSLIISAHNLESSHLGLILVRSLTYIPLTIRSNGQR